MPAVTAAKPYARKRRSAQYRRLRLWATIAWVSCGVRRGLFILLSILADDVQRENVQRQRHEEQHQAEREGRQGLGTVEFLVADQQGHDLHRHGGDGLERIRREIG